MSIYILQRIGLRVLAQGGVELILVLFCDDSGVKLGVMVGWQWRGSESGMGGCRSGDDDDGDEGVCSSIGLLGDREVGSDGKCMCVHESRTQVWSITVTIDFPCDES